MTQEKRKELVNMLRTIADICEQPGGIMFPDDEAHAIHEFAGKLHLPICGGIATDTHRNLHLE